MNRIVSSGSRLLVAVAAALVVVGLITAATLEKGASRELVGKVTAVESGSRTIVMDAPVGKGLMTVGAEVPDKTSITAGKAAKTLSDIKVGDKIKMRYVRQEDKLVVQSIAIQ